MFERRHEKNTKWGGDVSKNNAPRQEQRIARKLGGRVTAGSGNQGEKGDIRVTGVARIEAKTTRNKSFSVTQQMIEKINVAAMSGAEAEVAAIHIEFINDEGEKLQGVYVVLEEDFDGLVQEVADGKPV